MVAGLVGWFALRGEPGPPPPAHAIPGEGERITVEVLNSTGVDGLAREITRQLRRQGIDVVYFGTADSTAIDTTLILVRRGTPGAAQKVRTALGAGKVVSDPDSTLLLDVSVLVGADLARAPRTPR